MLSPTKTHSASTWMFTGCGIWLVAPGLYSTILRPPLLPEDPRLMGTTIARICADLHGLESWLSRVFTLMGGCRAGAGVLTVFLATTTMRLSLKGKSSAMPLSGASTGGLMSATNFALVSGFNLLLLISALPCIAGPAARFAKH